MSDTDLHEIKFEWPHTGPNSVVVTGTFDNWTSSRALTRTASGFVGTAQVPWNQKILYKFIVDGRWALKNDQPIEVERGTGFVNHVYISPPKPVKAPPKDYPSKSEIIADKEAGEGEVTKEAVSPICVDHMDSAPPVVPVPADAQEKHTCSPSAENTVAIVPEVTHANGEAAKPVEEPPTHPDDAKPAEEVKDVVSTPTVHPPEEAEKPEAPKEQLKEVKILPEPVVAPTTQPADTSTVKTGRPSSETAYSLPNALPTTPTKLHSFPSSGSPPSSPSSFKFNSLRSGSGKKRTSSFLQRIRDHFKSDSDKSKAQGKK